jgi:alpha-tubulin suppressor-like RCC1 family protein
MTDVTAIAAGRRHTIALKKDGTVWAWGANYSGQLGNGTKDSSNIPVKVKDLDNIKYIYVFDDQNWAVGIDGSLWSWGRVSSEESRFPPLAFKPKPTPIADVNILVPQKLTKVANVKTLCSEGNYTIVLKEDGTVWAWGNNKFGQLGDGTNNDREEALRINGLTDIEAIAAKGNRCIALKKDGTVWVWGRDLASSVTFYDNSLQNVYRDMASKKLYFDGTDIAEPELLTNILVPGRMVDLKNVVSVSAGLGHYAVIKSDGTVWVWGNNDYWQLGDDFRGTRYSKVNETVEKFTGYNIIRETKEVETKAVHDIRKIPEKVKGVSDIIAINTGNDYNLAVKSDGTVWAWGDNTSFKLGFRISEPVGQVLDLKLFDHLPTITPTISPTSTPVPTPEPEKEIILQIDNKIMTVNGTEKEIDPGIGTVPVIENGSTLLPIRALIEAVGGTVDWSVKENKEMHISIKANSKEILLVIGKNTTYVNGEEKTISVAPKIIKGRTMIPLRYVIENLGYKVDWDGDSKKITISY